LWKSLGGHEERMTVRSSTMSSDVVGGIITKHNVFYVAKRNAPVRTLAGHGRREGEGFGRRARGGAG